MAEHTPGPWRVEKYVSAVGMYCIVEPHGRSLAFTDIRANEADANLLAAAPDLLEACKRALRDMTEWDGDELIPLIEAAIAKAEGR